MSKSIYESRKKKGQMKKKSISLERLRTTELLIGTTSVKGANMIILVPDPENSGAMAALDEDLVQLLLREAKG